ncbi:MAG: electron transport complex subunit RsxC [Candidatus Omnitrophica bacterium]|nr:electron transport complex subunit RsxC [Candidatus Omnitrophota bacterium]
MVRIEGHKTKTENKSSEKLPLPSEVYIPLSQHLGKSCQPEVELGQYVLRGQRIANISAAVYAPVHASLSGKIVSVCDWPHPVLGRAKAIVVAGDGKDLSVDTDTVSSEQIRNYTPKQIQNIVLEAGIVGMGGAGFPTHIKLNPPKPVDTLIVNGAECEPFLTGDYRLMVENTDEILRGIEIVARCLGVDKVYIAIEDNKPQAIRLFDQKLKHLPGYQIRILKTQYPQGGEKQLIKNILGREVPRGKLPFDVGVVVHNVGTVFAIFEAVYLNKPLYERMVTVTGSCVFDPKNLWVRVGTPIKDLIEYCGLKENPAKIIIGGPMMGIAQYTDEVPVIKTTTGVILMNEQESKITEEDYCIRCGACIRSCPVGLMPCLINLASQNEMWLQAKYYGAQDCIECGLCSYVCPADRNLVQSIKRAKLEVSK